MARTTISVPDNLKTRMDETEEPVNWSAVACKAFEQKLGDLAEARKEKDMQDVIDRLRASAREDESELSARGHAAGKIWAENYATAAQLRRLTKYADEAGGYGGLFSGQPMAPYSHADYLAFAILGLGDDDQDYEESSDFWDSTVRDEPDRDEAEFLDGFVEGALAVWEAVADAL